MGKEGNKHPCLTNNIPLVLSVGRDEEGRPIREDGEYILVQAGVDEEGKPIYDNRKKVRELIIKDGEKSRAMRAEEVWGEDLRRLKIWFRELTGEQREEVLNSLLGEYADLDDEEAECRFSVK